MKELEDGEAKRQRGVVMEEVVKKKKNYLLGIWRVFYPILGYFGITLIVQIPFTFLLSASAIVESNGDMVKMQEILIEKVTALTLPLMLAAIVVTLPLALLLMKQDKKKKEAELGVVQYGKVTMIQWGMLALVAIAYCLFGNNLITLTNIIELFPGYNSVAQSIYGGGIIMEIVVVGVMAPIIEELLFRGLVHNRIKEYSKPLVAILLSAFIFGVYHLNMVQGIYAFGLGLLLSFCYEKFHTIWAPIVIHMAANLFSVFLTETEALQEIFSKNSFLIITTIICGIILAIILAVFVKVQQKERITKRDIDMVAE